MVTRKTSIIMSVVCLALIGMTLFINNANAREELTIPKLSEGEVFCYRNYFYGTEKTLEMYNLPYSEEEIEIIGINNCTVILKK